MSRENYLRYVCPKCKAGGSNPSNIPAPICHICKEPVIMQPIKRKILGEV